MRVGYFADGPWSHRALERIVEDERFEIAFIVPRYDTQDSILKQWAEQLEVDYLPFENVNLPGNVETLRRYDADLFVSMSFNQILKTEILGVAPLGFINCHAGALPYYRGRNILNWVLINDGKEFGVTVHYVDEGIDTGDIILQKMEKITDQDDYATLLDRAIVICADLLFESLVNILDGSVQRKVQTDINPVGFYCGRRVNGDEWIDWAWPSRRIFNFVRAITEPGPCARTVLNGDEVIVRKVSLIRAATNYIGTPGEIVGVMDGGIVVKTGDSSIFIENFSLPLTIKKIRIGHRFGLNLEDAVVALQKRIFELEDHSL